MIKVKAVLSFIILVWAGVICNAQVLEIEKYDISIAGISIGEMVAKKEAKGEEIHYELKSSVHFWFFGKVSLDYLTHAIYRDMMLIKATTTSKSNRGNFGAKIDWMKDHYDVKATNYKYELDTTIHKPYHYSSAVFYFEEPKQAKEFIPEAYGRPSHIKKVKDYYEVNVNGNKNRFYYVNGKLDKAVMEFPIKNYVVKRK
ncbi:DUF6134 family protein [Shivajiella indica]|uniref:DUF6134 family protein n=1 Tax=Shivajiella indica TaxID=872115 RepID=A0ABW5B681_9BACT